MKMTSQLLLIILATASLLGTVLGQCPTECTCEGTKTTCDLTTKTTFPDLPAKTETLIILGKTPNDGIIQSLTRQDLQKYENLTELTLSDLGIESLAHDTFSQLSKLKRIDLSNNAISQLPKGVFDNLPAMTYLDLSRNRLETITSDDLKFPLLNVLSLQGNSINLNDSTVFKNVRKLHLLDVSDNYIGDPVPLYDVPTDLRVVSMKNCSIKTLSPNLRNFVKNAERLQLQNNQITQIPPDFAPNLFQLKELYLDNNQITDIKNNTFENVVAYSVTLTNNKITNIQQDAFKSFETGMLRLENNEISNLPARLFHPLGENLKKLYLNDNPLKELGDETFSGLTGLTRLRLHSSKIETISDTAFLQCQGKELDLSVNNLTSLSNETVKGLANFKTVNLAENQWNCTAPLVSLRKWLLDNSQSQNCDQAGAKNCLKCADPEKFEGRLVVNLTEEELLTAMDPETTTPEPTTTTEEPTTTTEEPTTTTEDPTTPEPTTQEPTTAESTPAPTDDTSTQQGSTTLRTIQAGPNILLYVYIALGVLALLLIPVCFCLIIKACYKSREVTYPLAKKELENGYIPQTGEKQDDSVRLEHIFTIEGHANPGFNMTEDDVILDDVVTDLGTSTTSLSTFRPGRHEPCRDSGIVGDSPGSDQSINRPVQAWEGRTFGYENRTYSNLDEYT